MNLEFRIKILPLIRLGFYLSVFFLSSSLSKSLSTNFDVLDSISSGTINKIYSRISELSIDKIAIRITPHNDDWLIKKNLVEKRGNTELVFSLDSSDNQSFYLLEVWLNKIGVNYNYINDDDDLMGRNIIFDLSYSLYGIEGVVLANQRFDESFNDTISVDDICRIQDTPFDIAKGTLPEKELSFFGKYLEPAIVVLAGAATVLLLYTVRSK